MKLKIDNSLKRFSKIFYEAGFSCFLVGGAVRNLYAGIPVSDYDFTTDAHPGEIMKLFNNVIPTGIKHGTVTVIFCGKKLEVTTYRTDGKYSDCRHPDKIEFTSNIYEDLKRRDFTINAMAYNILTEEFLDPHNGKNDVENKIIRAIGNATERFNEDALRIMRACRFSSQLNFEIDKATLEGMEEKSINLKNVSSERIKDELNKILASKKPSKAFKIMEETKVLSTILPELSRCRGIPQKGFHNYDVFEHCIYSCDGAPKNNQLVRLSALFHDIGKAETLKFDEDSFPTFYKHESYSARMTTEILNRLKYPKKITAEVEHLIRNHMFNYLSEWSDSAVRRFVAKVGVENLDNLFKLRKADIFGMKTDIVDPKNLIDFQKRINKILEEDSAFSIADLDINGNDLIIDAGIPKGVMIGTILNFLLETVIDDPSQNKKDILLKLASNLYRQRLH